MAEGGRVIGGTARGTRLEVPRGAGTRPLADRVKESLFGALQSAGALDGPFLDLFAGTGAAGIEALSRGAPAATFVEKDANVCDVIDANLRRTHLRHSTPDGARVVKSDVIRFLSENRPPNGFSAVLLDPPYGDPALDRGLEILGDASGPWLSPGATVVAKHFWRDNPPEQVGALRRDRQKRFGETVLSFYTRKRRSDHGGPP